MTIEELKSLFPKSSIQEKDGFFNVSININKLLACDFIGFNTLNKAVYAEFYLYVNSFKQSYNPSLPLHKHYYSLISRSLSFHIFTLKNQLRDEISETTYELLNSYIDSIKRDDIKITYDEWKVKQLNSYIDSTKRDDIKITYDEKKVEQFINKTYEDISTILSKNKNFYFFRDEYRGLSK